MHSTQGYLLIYFLESSNVEASLVSTLTVHCKQDYCEVQQALKLFKGRYWGKYSSFQYTTFLHFIHCERAATEVTHQKLCHQL